MRKNFMASIRNAKEGRVWSLLTAAFSHMTISHLLFNMLSFYFLGRPVLQTIGSMRFFHLYLAGGLASTVVTLLLQGSMASQYPSYRQQYENKGALGASGSVMSVAVLFGALFPRQIVYVNFILPVPAALLVALYIAADLYGLSQPNSGVSNIGHLAGAGVGAAYFYYNLKKGRIVRTW